MRATARLRVVGVSLGVFLRIGKTAAGGTSCMLPMGDVMAARICHLRFILATSQHSARASAGIAEVARSFVHKFQGQRRKGWRWRHCGRGGEIHPSER